MRGMRTDQASHDRTLSNRRGDRTAAPYFLGREVSGLRDAAPHRSAAKKSPGGDDADRRYKIWWAMFLIGVLLGAALAWSLADAAERDYRVSWSQNPPDEQVDRYVVRVKKEDGIEIVNEVVGNPPKTQTIFNIDAPVGSRLSFDAIACAGKNCSDASAPVVVDVPPAQLTPPSDLRVVRGSDVVE